MFDCSYKAQFIDGHKEKFVRLDDSSSGLSSASDIGKMKRYGFNIDGLVHGSNRPSKSFRKGMKKGSEGLKLLGRSLQYGVSRAVFSEDLKMSENMIFDPQDKLLLILNRFIVVSCILSVAMDPLFFYLPIVDQYSSCIGIDRKLAITATTLRSIIDSFYIIRIILQFRTAYIAPSSRVFGRGELVIDAKQIAKRYVRRYFFVDLLAVLPFPQIAVWSFLHSSNVLVTKKNLIYIISFQLIPRLMRIHPLTSELKRTAGVVAETALVGAMYYMLWYMLASHAVGAFWYLLAVEREDACWQQACRNLDTTNTSVPCLKDFLYCSDGHESGYDSWRNISMNVLGTQCTVNGDKPPFNFGIYTQALQSGVLSSTEFIPKFTYCLWWGLQNLSTLGQGLQTSTFYGEAVFSILLAISGLLLFALLIGNMQTYLQSLTIRVEEMRLKRRDSERWMHHRMLPLDLRDRVRRYDQYKWLETRGVDEEGLVQSLPKYLRRDIKRHLCLALVRRVPLFESMDERLLDALCERLKPSLYTESTFVVREGDPVDEMLLVIRGRLESVTTDGGRNGFFNRSLLKEGDFCGEELLTWALDPKSAANLPSSTRTVRALTEVEAFALTADELKFVASQFRRLHSRQVQHTFRFYSQQWRTWAACFIQSAWRRYSKRKTAELRRRDSSYELGHIFPTTSSSGLLGSAIYASRFATNAMRGVQRIRWELQSSTESQGFVRPHKPSEPDFSVNHAD